MSCSTTCHVGFGCGNTKPAMIDFSFLVEIRDDCCAVFAIVRGCTIILLPGTSAFGSAIQRSSVCDDHTSSTRRVPPNSRSQVGSRPCERSARDVSALRRAHRASNTRHIVPDTDARRADLVRGASERRKQERKRPAHTVRRIRVAYQPPKFSAPLGSLPPSACVSAV